MDIWAHFFVSRAKARETKKPGFPLQVLGFAHANPVGFPLQSHCARTSGYVIPFFARQEPCF
jgi:hypothetical protein